MGLHVPGPFGFSCVPGATAGIIGHFLLQGGSCLFPVLDFVEPVRWSFPVLATPKVIAMFPKAF